MEILLQMLGSGRLDKDDADAVQDEAARVAAKQAKAALVMQRMARGRLVRKGLAFCPVCLSLTDDPVHVTQRCNHLLCRSCCVFLLQTPNQARCPICRRSSRAGPSYRVTDPQIIGHTLLHVQSPRISFEEGPTVSGSTERRGRYVRPWPGGPPVDTRSSELRGLMRPALRPRSASEPSLASASAPGQGRGGASATARRDSAPAAGAGAAATSRPRRGALAKLRSFGTALSAILQYSGTPRSGSMFADNTPLAFLLDQLAGEVWDSSSDGDEQRWLSTAVIVYPPSDIRRPLAAQQRLRERRRWDPAFAYVRV